MSILEIITYPDKLLRKISKPVVNIDGSLKQLIENMTETMYRAPGVGLAAIQVGIDKALLVYDIAPLEGKRCVQVLINPRIMEGEGEFLSENEGCLSVPDFKDDVKRFARVLVEGLDAEGNPRRFEADGYHALVLQHEIDHINGTLFIDHISVLKRELYKRQVRKKLKKA